MGLRLVFDVRTDADADPKRSVEDHFLAAIEPIAAFDRTFEIVLGALAVACLHRPWHESSSMRRRNDELTRTIISHLLTMQNRDEALRSEFVSFVREDAEAFLDAAEAQTATGQNMADEWLIEALRHGRVRSPDTHRSKAAADLINRRLAQWIACIPALAAQQHSTYFEQRLLIEVSTRHFEAEVQPHTLGCQILAGTPLQPFLRPIAARILSTTLFNPGLADELLSQVILLNRADASEFEAEALRLVEDWCSQGISTAGRKAIGTLLTAIGSARADAVAASTAAVETLDTKGDDVSPNIEQDSIPEGLGSRSTTQLDRVLATGSRAELEDLSQYVPSFTALLDDRSLLDLAAHSVRPQVHFSSSISRALRSVTDFISSRLLITLGGSRLRMRTEPEPQSPSFESFAIFQSFLAAASEDLKFKFLQAATLPGDFESWPAVGESCATPSPKAVERLLTSETLMGNPQRMAGLMQLLRCGPTFVAGPRLRAEMVHLIGSGRGDAQRPRSGDAALALAARLPDDPGLDSVVMVEHGLLPDYNFAGVELLARASRRVGLKAVADHLGLSGKLIALEYVADTDFSTLIDAIEADLQAIIEGRTTSDTHGRRAERRPDGLSAATVSRLERLAPTRLVDWAQLALATYRAGSLQLSIEAIALSLLPSLSRVAPHVGAALLESILERRFRRAFGQGRALPLAPSGLASAFAMNQNPEVDGVLKRLVHASPDDAQLAQVVGAAAKSGHLNRIEKFIAEWIDSDQPLTLAMAMTFGSVLAEVPKSVEGILAAPPTGLTRRIAGRLRSRIDARRRAQDALAGLKVTANPIARSTLETIALRNAVPGAPMKGDPGPTAELPFDRLLSIRLQEARERRLQDFEKTLFGLKAPPPWVPALTGWRLP